MLDVSTLVGYFCWSMTYSDLPAAQSILEQANTLAIFPARSEDLDSVASALALAYQLKQSGKKPIVFTGSQAGRAVFLDLNDEKLLASQPAIREKIVVTLGAKQSDVDTISYDEDQTNIRISVATKGSLPDPRQVIAKKQSVWKVDAILTVGVSSLAKISARFPKLGDTLYEKPVITLAHQTSAQRFGKANIIDLSARSCAEVTLQFLRELSQDAITAQAATCLYAAIMSKSNSFQHPTLSPAQFDLAADMLDARADRQVVISNLFKTKPLEQLHLWGKTLKGLTRIPKTEIAYAILSQEEVKAMGATRRTIGYMLEEILADITDAMYAIVLEQTAQDTKIHVIAPGAGSARDLVESCDTHAHGDDRYAHGTLQKTTTQRTIELLRDAGEKLARPRYTDTTSSHDTNFPTITRRQQSQNSNRQTAAAADSVR